MNTKEAAAKYRGLWWTKYTNAQLTMLEDVAANHPTPIRFKGTAERTVRALLKDGLIKYDFDVLLDGCHKSRCRRIWIVSATEKLLALEPNKGALPTAEAEKAIAGRVLVETSRPGKGPINPVS